MKDEGGSKCSLSTEINILWIVLVSFQAVLNLKCVLIIQFFCSDCQSSSWHGRSTDLELLESRWDARARSYHPRRSPSSTLAILFTGLVLSLQWCISGELNAPPLAAEWKAWVLSAAISLSLSSGSAAGLSAHGWQYRDSKEVKLYWPSNNTGCAP